MLDNEKVYEVPSKKEKWAWKIVCEYKDKLLTGNTGGVLLRRCEWMNALECHNWMGCDDGSWLTFSTRSGAQRLCESEDDKVAKVKIKGIISEGDFFSEKAYLSTSIYFPCST